MRTNELGLRAGERSGKNSLGPVSRRVGRTRLAAILVTAILLSSTFGLLAATSGSGRSASVHLLPAGGFPKYPVIFTESGLPSGTNWTADLEGTYLTNSTSSITFLHSNGTYNWSVLSIPAPKASGAAGWAANLSSGTIHVFGATVYVNITFLTAYNVTFRETGLPTGLNWTVSVNGTVHKVVGNYYTFLLPNATNYVFAIENPVPGLSSGSRYIPLNLGYTLTVSGKNLSRTDPFTAQFVVVTLASPAAGGTVGPASGWYNNQTVLTFSETPASGYRFLGWTGNGTGSYSGPALLPTIKIAAPITEVADLAALYTVTFTESGLKLGMSWSVTFNGSTTVSNGTTISFLTINGSYPYTVGAIAGWVASPSSGSQSVAGSSVNVPVSWTQFGFAVSFTETGLPTGTNWSVTLGGTQLRGTTATLTFTEPNNTYSFAVGGLAGFRASPASGSVTVAGAPVTVAVTWTVSTYAVTFDETGLPASSPWSVSLNGTVRSGSTGSIAFDAANGSYNFSIPAITGYLAVPASGTILVQGSAVSQTITFEFLYTVEVFESGLPSATGWSVTLNGVPGSANTSTATQITFEEPNGTYALVASGIRGYSLAPYSPTVTVLGAPVQVTLTWSLITYRVVFTETGLPNGTTWAVTMGGSLVSSTSATITFSVVNGSYTFTVTNVTNYAVTPSSGPLRVAGAAVSESVQFTSTSTNANTILGLTPLDLALIVVLVLLAAALIAALLFRRRRASQEKKE